MEPTLRVLADRLGLHPASYRGADGRLSLGLRLLLVAALLSLALWGAIGWGLLWLVGRLVQS